MWQRTNFESREWNLFSEIIDEHPSYEAEMSNKRQTLLPVIKKKAQNLHAWLQWVVNSDNMLSFLENLYNRKYSNLELTCRNTLTNNLKLSTRKMEND